MLNPKDLMDRVYGIVSPVFSKWKEWSPHELHLWESTKSKTILDVLEQDMMTLGRFFYEADEIGARSEQVLTAECLAYLRLQENSVKTMAITEKEIEKAIGDVDTQAHQILTTSAGAYDAPISWRITQQVSSAGRCSPASLEGLLEIYLDIANMFLLHDGNITPDEDERLKRFHAAFGR